MRESGQFLYRKKSLLTRLIAIAPVAVLFVSVLSQVAFAQNTYVITDGDNVTYHTSYATDPDRVLTEAGFELGVEDTYTTQETDGVSEINVQRVQSITIDNGGQILAAQLRDETVGQLLERMDIHVEPQDTVSHSLEEKTFGGMEIVITRTTYVTETYTQTIPYEVQEQNDATLPEGERQVLTAGSEGEMLCTAQVTYMNGVEISRRVVSTQITRPAVDEVVAVGTAQETEPTGELVIGDGYIVLETGEILTYDSTMKVKATAYNHQDAGCDMITATGTTVRWGTVAVDPKMIPYGTRMFIVSDSGDFVYGVATAEDCGGSIKGNRVDLYMPTKSECFAFGYRGCTIYFLT